MFKIEKNQANLKDKITKFYADLTSWQSMLDSWIATTCFHKSRNDGVDNDKSSHSSLRGESQDSPKQSKKIDGYFASLVNSANCHESSLFSKSLDSRNDGFELDCYNLQVLQ